MVVAIPARPHPELRRSVRPDRVSLSGPQGLDIGFIRAELFREEASQKKHFHVPWTEDMKIIVGLGTEAARKAHKMRRASTAA